MERKDGYYWIKWDKNSEWEICKYVSKNYRFQTTNGSCT